MREDDGQQFKGGAERSHLEVGDGDHAPFLREDAGVVVGAVYLCQQRLLRVADRVAQRAVYMRRAAVAERVLERPPRVRLIDVAALEVFADAFRAVLLSPVFAGRQSRWVKRRGVAVQAFEREGGYYLARVREVFQLFERQRRLPRGEGVAAYDRQSVLRPELYRLEPRQFVGLSGRNAASLIVDVALADHREPDV